MSAYMVQDETINKIVAWAQSNKNAQWILKRAGYDLEQESDRETFARRLFVLNKMGVESRYGRGEAKEFRALDFAYRQTIPPSNIHAYKAMQCLRYQCTEGRVPDTRLYNLLSDLMHNCASEIVSSLPAYNLAPWG